MATFSRVTPTGWSQGDDASDVSRVTPTGWEQVAAVGGTTTYTLSAATYAPGSLSSTGVTPRVTVTVA